MALLSDLTLLGARPVPKTNMVSIFYRMSDGSQPVDDFIDGLLPAHQAALDGKIEMLNRLTIASPPLPHPHSSQVRGQLRELRCHYGNVLYRIFYQRSGNFFILLHIIRKDTDALPEADIAIAQARWEDFQARMNADPRRPPRAMGDDAP
jgi:phage-related protein